MALRIEVLHVDREVEEEGEEGDNDEVCVLFALSNQTIHFISYAS
jgi:hypothetical protein